jgi:hypothetical protein
MTNNEMPNKAKYHALRHVKVGFIAQQGISGLNDD